MDQGIRSEYSCKSGWGVSSPNSGALLSFAHYTCLPGPRRRSLRALTPQTIQAAFRKTGVWPFDPTVITEEMMAPSKETSCEGHLPVVPATPVRVVAKLLQNLSTTDDNPDLDKDEDPSCIRRTHPNHLSCATQHLTTRISHKKPPH